LRNFYLRQAPEKLESIKSFVQQLPAAAASLNFASDELAKSVNDLDAILKRFSLGVPAWVTFASYGAEPSYHMDSIGYAKVGGRWGLAIRTVDGDERAPEDDVEQWLFSDAPRHLRVRAADKIPDLLEELIARAAETAKSITEKASDVRAVTTAMSAALEDTAQKTSKTWTAQPLEASFEQALGYTGVPRVPWRPPSSAKRGGGK
jgi:hypothetical protein